jgi:hypothetical protein
MRIINLADGYSSATDPTTTAVPTTADAVTFDPAGTAFTAVELQALGEETDDRLTALEGANFDDFRGYWNASTNTPALANGGGGGITEGDYYTVSVAGSTSIDGETDWQVGDDIFFDGTVWKKKDNTSRVLSVAGKTGVVTLDAADVSETATLYWAKKFTTTTADPTTGDDSGDGYAIGSRWFNSTTKRLYIATDVTPGAAVWVQVEGDLLSVNSMVGNVVLDATDIDEAGGRYWSLKNNLAATVAPTVNDDSGDGFAAGSLFYNQSTNFLYVCEDATPGAAVWALAAGGGAGGGLDTFFTETFEITVPTDLAKGNGAFGSGGSFAGTVASETGAPLNGTRSLKITQAGGSLNDYIELGTIPIKGKQRVTGIIARIPHRYDGAVGNWKFVARDETNGVIRTIDSDTLFAPSGIGFGMYRFTVPDNCASLKIGLQVAVLNSGKILYVDDVELTTSEVLFSNVLNLTDAVDGGAITIEAVTSNPTKGTVVQDKVYHSRIGQRMLANYRYEQSAMGAIGSGDYLFALPGGQSFDSTLVTFYTGALVNSANSQQMARSIVGHGQIAVGAGSGYTGQAVLIAYDSTRFRVFINAQSNGLGSVAGSSLIGSSGYSTLDLARVAYGFWLDAPISGWTATAANVVTPQAGDDSSVVLYGANGYASTATKIPRFSTSSTAGDAITYADSGTNGPTLTVTRAGVYTVCYTARLTGVGSIGISKNAPSLTTDIFSVAEANKLAQATAGGASYAGSCSWTGPLSVGDIVRPHNDGTTFAADANIFTITRIGFKSLSAVPVPMVAYLKDVKTSGTAGGTFTSGAWQTRTLNTVEGDLSVATLSSNQFTLQPGTYVVEIQAPAGFVNIHKAKLRNITDSTDDIIGTSEHASNAGGIIVSKSACMGTVTITTAKTFEVQHRCSTTYATDGFGYPSSLSVSEVYTQVKITKVK